MATTEEQETTVEEDTATTEEQDTAVEEDTATTEEQDTRHWSNGRVIG